MEQTIETVQQFMADVERLVIQEISKDRIKKTRIRHLNNSRTKLEKIQEPFRTLTLRLLDEIMEFANILNDQGPEVAEEYARKALGTFDEIGKMAERVSSYGV